MIPMLFDTRGDIEKGITSGVLTDCLSCEVTEEKNSLFECIFVYPIAGNAFEQIGVGKYIKVLYSNSNNLQIFRIYRHVGNDRGTVTFYCEHISYLLNGIAILPFSLASHTIKCQDALLRIRNNMRPWSNVWNLSANNITNEGYLKDFKKPITMREALLSESGILGVRQWSNFEYEFDNYNIILHESRGKQLNFVLNYGKNIENIESDFSIGDTYTHMLPFVVVTDGKNGNEVVVTLSEGTAFDPEKDALLPYKNSDVYKDKRVYIAELDDYNGTVEGAKNVLEEWASAEILYSSRKDIPATKITISYVDFLKSLEYSNMQGMSKIGLCDWVTLYYKPLNISVNIQIVRLVYDVLNETYKELGLSNPKEVKV